MPQDKFFGAPFGRNISPGVLYGNNFAVVYGNSYFSDGSSAPIGFSIDLTGYGDSSTFFNEANLSLDVGLGGYISSNTTSQISQITNSFSDWSTYWELTPVNPTGTVTGFPAFLNLSLLSGLGSIARSDGGDIRVSDTSNRPLACDLMPWYVSGSGGLYINLGTKTTGTQPVRVWAGNATETLPAVDSTYGQYATYNTGIRGFYPSGGGQDRTSYQNHLTTAGGISYSPGFVVGTMAGNYDGVIESIATGTIPAEPPYYLSATQYMRSTSDQAIMMLYRNSQANQWYELNTNTPLGIRAAVYNATGAGYLAAAIAGVATGIWQNSAAIFRALDNKCAFLSGIAGAGAFNYSHPGSMDRLAIGYRQGFGRASGLIANCAFLTYVVPDAWASYQHANMADTNQTGFWISVVRSDEGSPEGSSVLLTGVSNSLTYSIGQFYQSYPLVGSSLSNTSFSGGINNVLSFQGISNNYTYSIGNIVSNISFVSVSNTYTDSSGALRNILRLDGFSNTQTYDSGNLRLELGFLGISQTTTNDFGTLNNNLSFVGGSNTQTTEAGNLINSLVLAGTSNTITSDSGNLRNNVTFAANSYSNTVSYADVRNSLGFVGHAGANTSSLGNTITNLAFGGFSNTYTADIGDLRNSIVFAGQSNSETRALGTIRNNLNFAGSVGAITSSSLDVRISYALNALSSSVTATEAASLNLQGAVALAGLISANTSSDAVLNLLLVLNATAQVVTILEQAGININTMLSATSSSITAAFANINKIIALGGDIDAATASTANIQLNILLNGLIGAVTQLDGTLNQQGQVALEGVINVLSQVTGYINVDLSFSGIIHNNTGVTGNLSQSIAQALEGIINARTSSSGAVVREVGLDAISDNNSNISGTIKLNVGLDSIVQVLTSLNGEMEGIVVENGKIVTFTVYKMTNHNFSVGVKQSFNESVLLVGR